MLFSAAAADVVVVFLMLLAAGKRQQLIRESEPAAWRESLNVTLPGHCLSSCSQVAKVPGSLARDVLSWSSMLLQCLP